MKTSTAVKTDFTVITGAPEKTPTIMAVVPETEGATVLPVPQGTDATATMITEEAKISEIPVSTTATEHFVTELHVVETAAPAAATDKAGAGVTKAADAKPKDGVVIEEGTDEASGEKRCSGTNGAGR